jgi:hypothetical protein
MATEAVQIRDGSNTVAAANYSNGQSLAGPSGSGQFLAVALSASADRTSVLASTQGQQVYGILQNKPTAGAAADVCLFGITKAVAGGTITRGSQLMVNASGQLITWTAGSAYSQVAVALESAVSGQIVTVFYDGTSSKVLT